MEKGTLHELQVKRKKMKHDLCHVGLVVLTILLFLPMALRIIIRDPEEEKKEEGEKKVYISLNCVKGDESISSTFLNDKPQSIMYKIKGNHVSINNPDEDVVVTSDSVSSDNNQISEISDDNNATKNNVFGDDESVMDVLSKVSSLKYDEQEDASIIKMNYSYMSSIPNYDVVFGTIKGQEAFYQSRGFACTQVEF